MLGNYSKSNEEYEQNDSEVNVDTGSNRLHQNSNLIGEDIRSHLNTNSRENSEIDIETTRMISEEITNQMSRGLSEIRTSLNFHIQDAFSTAINETVLPSIQSTLEAQGRDNFTTMDRGSSGPHRSSEVRNPQKPWENCPKMGLLSKPQRFASRENSVDSNSNDQDHDSTISYQLNSGNF